MFFSEQSLAQARGLTSGVLWEWPTKVALAGAINYSVAVVAEINLGVPGDTAVVELRTTGTPGLLGTLIDSVAVPVGSPTVLYMAGAFVGAGDTLLQITGRVTSDAAKWVYALSTEVELF